MYLNRLRKQLNKLIDVKEIVELPAHESVCRELVMIKVECGPEKRQQVSSIADIFRANIVDVSKESMIIALTGSLSKMMRLWNFWKISTLRILQEQELQVSQEEVQI